MKSSKQVMRPTKPKVAKKEDDEVDAAAGQKLVDQLFGALPSNDLTQMKILAAVVRASNRIRLVPSLPTSSFTLALSH